MKIVIGPIHRKVGAIQQSNLTKTTCGNQHALSARRMLDRQIARDRQIERLPFPDVRMPGRRITAPLLFTARQSDARTDDALCSITVETLYEMRNRFRLDPNVVIDPHDEFRALL